MHCTRLSLDVAQIGNQAVVQFARQTSRQRISKTRNLEVYGCQSNLNVTC